MKFMYFILSIIFLAAVSVSPAAADTRPSLAPVVIQEIGQGEVSYGLTVYPEFTFSRYPSSAKACAEACLMVGGKPITQSRLGAPFEFEPILETTVNFRGQGGIGREYQKYTGIFVTWTIRVVGKAEFLPIATVCQALGIGGRWSGYAYEEFKGGKVFTRLLVNGQPRGNEAVMTIPFQGGIGVYTPSDPTITGSAYLRPEDFGGEFPNRMDFRIEWLNNTSLIIISPLDEGGNTARNLIITVMPVQN
ncbi:MAG: hypothetical protein NG737_00045 [Omnitrophica bacterium]|nr:hypothetical protein [Candidatus Omnitrophota bacterium]